LLLVYFLGKLSQFCLGLLHTSTLLEAELTGMLLHFTSFTMASQKLNCWAGVMVHAKKEKENLKLACVVHICSLHLCWTALV
jgi:hypothetical protein